ncbi:TetR/AcrR family transcriptional regulator (plasmid) [Streptomyces sp. BI20]|uniref:TetR/AcrR family transcriptional regulator n=1 Tax=Streptomyces sp. BI20 TaxID=3403460 RepID=UPI003C75719B
MTGEEWAGVERVGGENGRPLRADAARNAARIVAAARVVYAEQGPEAPLDEVARVAGVGIATLFRRFPDKGALLRAVLDRRFQDDVLPAAERALRDEDPRRGLILVLEAAVAAVARDHHVLIAARDAGVLSSSTGDPFFAVLERVAERGRAAGVLREDLVAEDLRRITVMLIGVLWTVRPGSDGWRRYVALVVDGLAPAAAHPLPVPAPPLHHREG